MKERTPLLIFALLISVSAFITDIDKLKPSEIFLMIGLMAFLSASHPF